MKAHDARPGDSSLSVDIFKPKVAIPVWDDFRGVVESSGDLLTVLDGEGRILYDNPAVETVLGYRHGELVGSSAFALIHPTDYPAAVSLLAELAAGARTSGTLAFRFRRRDGRWCRLESSGSVAVGPAGSPRIIVASRERHRDPEADPPAARRTSGLAAAELEEARIEVVERLARAAEFRDDDTRQHQRRVGELSAGLAARLRLPPRQVEVLRRAAPLHDVGKLGIPDAILLKPGPLLPEEEEVMRTHPVLGARILSGGGTALVRAAEQIALFHHERWDGAGYPRGLSRRRIPLFARLVSIVDVYDALTHDRPYRRAWESTRVLELIRTESGAHFEPEMAAEFVKMMGEKKSEVRSQKSEAGTQETGDRRPIKA